MKQPTRRDWFWRQGEYLVPSGSVWREAELDGPQGTFIVAADFIRRADGSLVLWACETFCDDERLDMDSDKPLEEQIATVKRTCAEPEASHG